MGSPEWLCLCRDGVSMRHYTAAKFSTEDATWRECGRPRHWKGCATELSAQFKKKKKKKGELEAAVVIVQTALASCRGWWYPAH